MIFQNIQSPTPIACLQIPKDLIKQLNKTCIEFEFKYFQDTNSYLHTSLLVQHPAIFITDKEFKKNQQIFKDLNTKNIAILVLYDYYEHKPEIPPYAFAYIQKNENVLNIEEIIWFALDVIGNPR